VSRAPHLIKIQMSAPDPAADPAFLFAAYERGVDGHRLATDPGAAVVISRLAEVHRRALARAAAGCDPGAAESLFRAVSLEWDAQAPAGVCQLGGGPAGPRRALVVSEAAGAASITRRVFWASPAACAWAVRLVAYSLLPWRVQIEFPPSARAAPLGQRRSLVA
jgi:hypothetical protein